MQRRRKRIRVHTHQSPSFRWWGPISRALDTVLAALKWPVALAALIALPFSVIASLKLLGRIWAEPTPVAAFILGLVAYFVAWHFIFRHRLFGTFFSTLEHELTHALFALTTFHPIQEIKSTFRTGGHVKYQTWGTDGNWLITISPYFFPTLSIALLLLLAAVPSSYRWWAEWLLGALTAYHVTSTMRETHAGQTDIQKVGFLFSFLFLPAANIISFGVIVAFCHSGLSGVAKFIADMIPQVG